MQDSLQIIMKSLEVMDTWKILVIGVLFLWAVKIALGVFATGFTYFALPWRKFIKGGAAASRWTSRETLLTVCRFPSEFWEAQ